MKPIKNLLIILGLLLVALSSAVVAAEVYRQVKHPDVPRQEADVFFDIGMVFLLTFVSVAGMFSASWLMLRKRRTR